MLKYFFLQVMKGTLLSIKSLKNRQASKKLSVIGNEGKYVLDRICSDGVNKFIIMLVLIFQVLAFIAHIKA